VGCGRERTLALAVNEILPAALFALAAGLALRAWWFQRKARRSLKWRETKGVITRSEVQVRTQYRQRLPDYDEFRPLVEYTYEVPGPDRVGTRVYYGSDTWKKDVAIANAVCARYVVGQRCRVYVNPYDLEQSVLVPGETEGARATYWLAVKAALAAPAVWVITKILYAWRT